MYKRPETHQLAASLGIKQKVLEADIRDLAWLWEMTVGDMNLRDPLSALDVLNTIARAYIRGRDCRMGSYQTMWRHLPTKAAVIYHLTKYVSEENMPELVYAHFPRLRSCGVTSVDDFLAQVNRLSRERSRRQEEEEKQKANEARETRQQRTRDFIQNLRAEKRSESSILDEIRRFVDGDERG